MPANPTISATEPQSTPASATAIMTLSELHAAWKRARAAWHAAQYAPENLGADGEPRDLDGTHCELDSHALNAFLQAPAENLAGLVLKLRACVSEEIHDGWVAGGAIIAQLAQDAAAIASATAIIDALRERRG